MANTTAYDNECARINARLAELDRMVEQIDCMLSVNRAVLNSRNCKMQDKVQELSKAIALLKGGAQ
jgi:hypothetical protein